MPLNIKNPLIKDHSANALEDRNMLVWKCSAKLSDLTTRCAHNKSEVKVQVIKAAAHKRLM